MSSPDKGRKGEKDPAKTLGERLAQPGEIDRFMANLDEVFDELEIGPEANRSDVESILEANTAAIYRRAAIRFGVHPSNPPADLEERLRLFLVGVLQLDPTDGWAKIGQHERRHEVVSHLGDDVQTVMSLCIATARVPKRPTD